MRSILVLLACVGVAAAAATWAVGTGVTLQGAAMAADLGVVGSVGPGSYLKITTNLVADSPLTAPVGAFWFTTAACDAANTPTDAEKKQAIDWVLCDTTKLCAWLDVSAVTTTAAQKICFSATGDGGSGGPFTAGAGAFTLSTTVVSSNDVATGRLTSGPCDFGCSVTVSGAADAFAAGNMIFLGNDLAQAIASDGGYMFTATGTSTGAIVIKAAGDASGTWKPFLREGTDAAGGAAGKTNFVAQTVVGSHFEYSHSISNMTLTKIKVDGTEKTTLAANYTVGSNITFFLQAPAAPRDIQGPNYAVTALETGAATSTAAKCWDAIAAGMYVNATSGAYNTVSWHANTIKSYDIWVKSWSLDAAGHATVVCTKQPWWSPVVVVAAPVPSTTTTTTSTTSTSTSSSSTTTTTTAASAGSSVRSGLVAVFACALAGLGLTAAF